MSVTSGFFNSVNGDRKYNAEQMSAIFDGIINDGVFKNVGNAFTVECSSDNTVSVGKGKAWFNSTWIVNDDPLLLTVDEAELLLDRYDAVVIEVDRSVDVRAGSIKIIKGTPSSSPTWPSMTHTDEINQYPIAVITRKAGSTSIAQRDIEITLGTDKCPYATLADPELDRSHVNTSVVDQGVHGLVFVGKHIYILDAETSSWTQWVPPNFTVSNSFYVDKNKMYIGADDSSNGIITTSKSLTLYSGNNISLDSVKGTSVTGGLNVIGNTLKVNGRTYAQNKVLWNDVRYMSANHTITLSEKVSAQPNGIVLVFSRYLNGEVINSTFSTHFISKWQVSAFPSGGGYTFFLVNHAGVTCVGVKHLYITDEQIKGDDNNILEEQTNYGLKHNNKGFVLRYVIGV